MGLLCIDEIFKNINVELFPELRSNNNYGLHLIKVLIKGRNKNNQIEIPKRYQFILEVSVRLCNFYIEICDKENVYFVGKKVGCNH